MPRGNKQLLGYEGEVRAELVYIRRGYEVSRCPGGSRADLIVRKPGGKCSTIQVKTATLSTINPGGGSVWEVRLKSNRSSPYEVGDWDMLFIWRPDWLEYWEIPFKAIEDRRALGLRSGPSKKKEGLWDKYRKAA